MPITLPVSATADDRAFKRIADRYEKWGQDTGRRIGGEFAKSMDEALSKADPKAAEKFDRAFTKVADSMGKVRVEEKKLQDLRARGASDTRVLAQAEALERARRAEARATSDATRAYQGLHSETSRMSAALGGLNSALAGTRFGQLAGDTQRLAEGFGAVGLKAGLAITGVAAAAVGITAAVKQLYDLGKAWDEVSDKITVRTGAIGADLDKITDSVGRVAEDTAAPLAAIGDIAGQVAQSLKLVGPSADGMIQALADLQQMGMPVEVRDLAKAFRILGVDQANYQKSLEDLFHVAQSTGIPLQELVSSVQSAGKAGREMGLGFAQTAQLVAAFEEAGTDGSKAATALGIALKNFAKDGREPQAALRDTVTEIKRLSDSGNDVDAAALAAKTFGKSWTDVFPVIQDGKLDIDNLTKSLDKNRKSIHEAAEETGDLEESWQKLKNTLSNEFKPVAETTFNALNTLLEGFINTAKMMSAPFEKLFDDLGRLEGVFGATVDGTPVMAPDRRTGPGIGSSAGIPLPTTTDGGGGGGGYLGDGSGRSDKPDIPTSRYSLDQIPLGGFPGEAGTNGPGSSPEQQKVFDAQTAEIRARQGVENARKRVLELQQDNNATQADVQAAQNDLQVAQRQFLKAQQDVVDAQQGGSGTPGKLSIPASQYGLSAIPFGQFPGEGGIQGPGRRIEQHTGPGFYEVDPQRVFDAQTQELSAQQRLEDARRKVLEVQADNDATEQQHREAQDNLVIAQRQYLKSQADVLDAQQGVWKSMDQASKDFADGMTDISAALDSDFGVSQGLPGIAENLLKFVTTLAMAPVIGALQGVQTGLGFKPGSAGSGLAGMVGSALGMAQPATKATPPVKDQASSQTTPGQFYPQTPGLPFTPRQATLSQPSTASAATPSAYGGDATLLSAVPAGRYQNPNDAGNWDLTQGLADCSSAVEDLVNLMDGRPTAGRAMSTGNAAEWLTSHGFMPTSTPVPGAFNVGYNSHHMEATLPGGTNFNWGSDSSAASGGTSGAVGAFGDPSFTSHYYRPASGIAPSAAGGLGGRTSSSGGAVSVFVVNMPGGGFSGGPTGPGSLPAAAGSGLAASSPGGHISAADATRQQTLWDQRSAAAHAGMAPPGAAVLGGSTAPSSTFSPPTGGGGAASPGAYAPLTPSQLTDPGLITPTPIGAAPGVGAGVGTGPLPGPVGGPGTGRLAAGTGIPQAGPGFTPGSSVQGGRVFGQDVPASGGIGFGGGLIGMAGNAISGAAGMAATGAAMGMDGGIGGAVTSAVAQIGIQEAQRAIAYVGQLGGIAVGGLMETFSLNDSALADPGKSWLGRIAMGVAGARPALPNTAGAEGGDNNPDMAESGDGKQPQPPGPVDPTKTGGAGGDGSEGTSGANTSGKTVNNNTTINYTANQATEDRGGADVARHMEAATFPGMG